MTDPLPDRPPAQRADPQLGSYPAQEPFSDVTRAYHDKVMERGRNVSGGEVIAYGSNPYQRVLFYPAARSDEAVLAFIHGGGWTNGYKEWMSFMAPAFAQAGISFASIGYRLAPQFVFPAGVNDCADAVLAIRKRAPGSALFIGGHSAGGHYAAWLAVRSDWWKERSLTANPIRGCLPISGVYVFGDGSGLSMRPRFLGSGSTEDEASPINRISGRTPFLIAFGQRDFPHLIPQAHAMAKALAQAGNQVEELELPGCNHFEASYQAGDPDDLWFRAATAFIRRNCP
jgi:acetyl esterase/lipase